MGARSRAGWYSYDFIDNGPRRSAARIVEELQHIAVGTLFPAVPGATDGFHVLQFETGRSLVLGWRPAFNALPIVTWAFVLDGVNARTTRLVVRARGAREYPFYRASLIQVDHLETPTTIAIHPLVKSFVREGPHGLFEDKD
jgi:hypothetical protein